MSDIIEEKSHLFKPAHKRGGRPRDTPQSKQARLFERMANTNRIGLERAFGKRCKAG
jgi:hypothetical protein